MNSDTNPVIRLAELSDVDALLAVETACFSTDMLSKRSFKHYIQVDHAVLLVAETPPASGDSKLLGYGLIWCLSGTRLARLYSLAVLPQARGTGLAKRLLMALEDGAAHAGKLYMRLEVAKNNTSAIKLYQQLGYRIFGEYTDYYEDHSDALRMQKTIRFLQTNGINRPTPWYQQTTEFTCGPASLLMAMASLGTTFPAAQTYELDIWREATTIYMTSGMGGCHPFGLALAAKRRGFEASVYINTEDVLFLDGVRTDKKKRIMTVAHDHFLDQCQQQQVAIEYQDFSIDQVEQWLREGAAILMLISTYSMDGKKSPHWVVVTGLDDSCLYVHDPDTIVHVQQPIDCQYVPIARDDFKKLSTFGRSRLRVAVILHAPQGNLVSPP